MKTLSVAGTVVLPTSINCLDRVDLIRWLRVEHLSESNDYLNFVRFSTFSRKWAMSPWFHAESLSKWLSTRVSPSASVCLNAWICVNTQLLSVKGSSNTGKTAKNYMGRNWPQIFPILKIVVASPAVCRPAEIVSICDWEYARVVWCLDPGVVPPKPNHWFKL